MLKKIFRIGLILIAGFGSLQAQDYISPLSGFAVGELQSNNLTRYRALGGASIASMQSNVYTLANPASYSNLTSFCLETGFGVNYFNLKTPTQSYNYPDFELSYLSFAIPLVYKYNWGFSAGLVPYSKSGLNTVVNKTDSLRSREAFNISGGLSKFYMGTSFELFHNFFLGANASYIFGNTNLVDSLSFPDSSNFYRINKTSHTTVGDFAFDVGAIYRIQMRNQRKLQLGLSFSLPSKLQTTKNIDFISLDPQGKLFDSLKSEKYQGITYLPMKIGAGINYIHSDSFQIFADVTMRQWSKYYGLETTKDSFENSLNFGAGIEFMPGSDAAAGKFMAYLGKIRYRIGASYGMSGFSMNNNPIVDKRVTLGFGFPVSRAKAEKNEFSFLDFSVELGQMADLEKNKMRQQYVLFSFGVHLFEPEWFKRTKID